MKYNHLFDQYGKVDVKYEENKAYQISKEKYNSPIVMSDFSSETPNTVLLLIKSCYDNDDLVFKVNSILSNETAQSVKLNSNYQQIKFTMNSFLQIGIASENEIKFNCLFHLFT